ncbi:MAG: hypothetical protein ACFCD0_15205 [Gemmataceae bacterium]
MRSMNSFGGVSTFLIVATLSPGAHGSDANTNTAKTITFAEHIAPLIHNNCTSCHRPGQSGPFPLITHKDVWKRARTIQRVINSRYMPPWQPKKTDYAFANERRLSKQQIEIFNQWVKTGRPKGDMSKMPPMPRFPQSWYLGKPDMVVKMKGRFKVRATGPDVYRSFVLPLDLREDKWVRAVEVKPNAKSSMHHAIFFLDSTGVSRRMDGQDGQTGFNGMGPITGALGGYVPGAVPLLLPNGLARKLPKGSDIVMQTHFHPSGKEEFEQATVAFYFAKEPPKKKLVGIMLPPFFGRFAGIDIPAGKSDYTVKEKFTLPVDAEGVTIGGHAHYICKAMKMTAKLPSGETNTLLHIDDWNLDWQGAYLFKDKVALPKGTVLETTLIYDNSKDNPRNPNSPPKRIRWGRQSTDEMGNVTLLVVAANPEEEDKLRSFVRNKLFRGFGDLFNRGIAGKRQVQKPAAKGGQKAGQMMQRFDKNRDGKLQKSEVPALLRNRLFSAFDRNNDGVLDRDELVTIREKFGKGNRN